MKQTYKMKRNTRIKEEASDIGVNKLETLEKEIKITIEKGEGEGKE